MRWKPWIVVPALVAVNAVAQSQTPPAASASAPAASSLPPVASAPPAQPSTSTSTSTSKPVPAPAPVTVYLEADNPNAALQVRPESAERNPRLAGVDGWEHACMAPCGIPLNPKLQYRVGGADIATSYGFNLPKGQNPVTVHARAGSAARDSWGHAIALSGASLVMLGGITLATMGQAGAFKNDRPGDTSHTVLIVGVTTMVIGGVLIAIGLPVGWGAGTDIKVEPQPKRAAVLTPAGLVF